jgi:hypothetical protein
LVQRPEDALDTSGQPGETLDQPAENVWKQLGAKAPVFDDREWVKVKVEKPRTAVKELRKAGFSAQLNHKFFADDLGASPFYGSPFYGSPFYGSPFYGSPFYGSPFYGSVFADPEIRDAGFRRNSAVPAPPPPGLDTQASVENHVRVAVLDTGWAWDKWRPDGLKGVLKDGRVKGDPEKPDAGSPGSPTGSPDGYPDPAAGHGTFVIGIIEQLTPGCSFDIRNVTHPDGDVNESGVIAELEKLALMDFSPHIVVMPFSGYLSFDEWMRDGAPLAKAIAALNEKGTLIVASAGNHAQWAPAYPAAFREVIGVAALDESGRPAPFTNYGTWVDACAVGTNVVSLFFGNKRKAVEDPDRKFYKIEPWVFRGWARWSGTSFAAPRVAAALAREIAKIVKDDHPYRSKPNQGKAEGVWQTVVGRRDADGESFGGNRYPTLGTVVYPG